MAQIQLFITIYSIIYYYLLLYYLYTYLSLFIFI